MFNRLTSRHSTWPALLAAAVLVCWPSFVQGSCCCESKRTVRTEGIEPASSCWQSKSTCCSAEVSSETRTCCDTSGVDSITRCGSSNDCPCGVRCCRDLKSIAISISPNSDAPRSADYVVLAEAVVEFPTGVRVATFERPDDPLHFLLAQDRCAQICRWRK